MADPPPARDVKAALRGRLRVRRRAFVDALEARRDVEAGLAGVLAHQLLGARRVGAYRAIRDEIDPFPALALLPRTVGLALPRMVGMACPLLFHAWAPGDVLVPNAIGIEEPDACAPLADPDVVLVPLIGFDRHGGRLGQGGGHYDRTLGARPRVRRIGLAWSVQEVDAVPREPWDIALDAVLTEREWIAMPERSRRE